MTGRRDSTDTQMFEEDEEKNDYHDDRAVRAATKEQEVLLRLAERVRDMRGDHPGKVLSQKTINQHSSYIIIGGMVFNLEAFIKKEVRHPGGNRIIEKQLREGKDATTRFTRWHHPSGNAIDLACKYYVGDAFIRKHYPKPVAKPSVTKRPSKTKKSSRKKHPQQQQLVSHSPNVAFSEYVKTTSPSRCCVVS